MVTGACAKFYICDEEGAAVAEQYQYEYKEKLILMVRDYSHLVPEEFRVEHQGYMIDYASTVEIFMPDKSHPNNLRHKILTKNHIEQFVINLML